ncbi:MAG: hypothetical protein OMM_10735 [Candidatus Magnetoglobus multicellularis str. Araruama]|uniref:Glycosyltransferase 2-like domain-containing protein n=1 Tax=Candidatus Magnetoglobus multicellularis str. Araruama TaxID=890399 RepID=A0A1V1P0D3_9BACT|nr:MAG: hypothetical protein OMM_10735 [Candidatus Magnetoglobus multicellularis str. Araruama]
MHHFNSTKDKNVMDSNPILSVIIASYNSKNKISHCLKSLEFAGDARNIGIQAAQSDIIAFIDADCRAKKGLG